MSNRADKNALSLFDSCAGNNPKGFLSVHISLVSPYLTDGVFSPKGYVASHGHNYKQFETTSHKYTKEEFFTNTEKDISIYIRDQIIFSINENYFWSGDFKIFSDRTLIQLEDFQFHINPDTEDQFLYSENGKKIYYLSKDEGQHCTVVIPLTKSQAKRGLSIKSIQLKNYPNEIFISGCHIKPNFTQYKAWIQMYLRELNLPGIDIKADYEVLCSDTTCLIPICEFLDSVFHARKRMADVKPSSELKISLYVPATYDKSYYSIAKLADYAVSVSEQFTPHQFHLVFSGNQTELIFAVFCCLPSSSEERSKIQIPDKTIQYLEEYSYDYWLGQKCHKTQLEYQPIYYQVSKNYRDFIIKISKGLNKKIKNELDIYYSEIARENRIKTRWVNEYKLFYLISLHYNDAIYQYRSSWLGKQSLDIFIPSINIAIEYQGQQHYKPIDVFGGEDSYENHVSRDYRKKELCRLNKVTLLEWIYTFPVNEENITSFFKDHNITLPPINLANPHRSFGSIMAPYPEEPITLQHS